MAQGAHSTLVRVVLFVATIHFSPVTCCFHWNFWQFPLAFFAFIHGFFPPRERQNSHDHPCVHYSLSSFTTTGSLITPITFTDSLQSHEWWPLRWCLMADAKRHNVQETASCGFLQFPSKISEEFRLPDGGTSSSK